MAHTVNFSSKTLPPSALCLATAEEDNFHTTKNVFIIISLYINISCTYERSGKTLAASLLHLYRKALLEKLNLL